MILNDDDCVSPKSTELVSLYTLDIRLEINIIIHYTTYHTVYQTMPYSRLGDTIIYLCIYINYHLKWLQYRP